jgi:hypothetical protein
MNTENSREIMGLHYMRLAVQFGSIELKRGLSLFSGAGIQNMGLSKDVFPTENFYFLENEKIITDCYDPLDVLRFMEAENEHGFVLPVVYGALPQ